MAREQKAGLIGKLRMGCTTKQIASMVYKDGSERGQRKGISAAIWIVCAVRMAVLQYGYGVEYSVGGIKKEMINGCDNGFGCENPEQNLRSPQSNRNPTTASFEPKNHNLLHHNPNHRKFYAQKLQPQPSTATATQGVMDKGCDK